MHLLRNVNYRVALFFALIPAARPISAQTSADDSDFRFVTTKTVNCAWLNKSNSAKRIAMYCGEPSIMEACSASCDASVTCEDTNDFMFELNFFGNSVGCDWFTKRNTARRTGKYCVESGSFFDAEIADKCVASCGLCEEGDAPTASPVTSAPAASGPTSSCQDSTDRFALDRNGNMKGCHWAAVNPTKRCKRDPTQQKCPETCGSCGETTPAPTQGPTAPLVTTPKATPAPTQGPTAAPVTTPKATPSPTQGTTTSPITSPETTPAPTQGPTQGPTKGPTKGPTVAPVTTPTTPAPTRGTSAAPKTTPTPTRGPTQGTTAAPVITPETTPAPTQGPTAAATTLCPNGASSPFTITLMNMGSNTDFDAAFASAKAKWESIIKCDLQDIASQPSSFDWFNGQFSEPFNGAVDDIVIGFSLEFIDGESNALGFAGAQFLRGQTGLSPISGIMVFDQDDFAAMSPNDAEIIILHEMGHILGLVNLDFSACFSSCNSGEFDYGWSSGCSLASDEYNALGLGIGDLKVENDGGVGTMCGHWEEDSFPKSTGSSELMTGFFESGFGQPITRVTIAALDEGIDDYVVDYDAANPYPSTNNALAREGGSKVHIPDTTFTIRDRMVELPPPIPFVQGN